MIIGNEKQIKALEQCILDNIPVLIWGRPGIGKTYSVHLIANKHRYKVVEYNASDQRTKDVLNKIKREVTSPSLVKKIYLFDEFDGMENYSFFIDIIKNSQYPIVMTANDYYKIPENIRERLETYARIIRYYPPSKRDMVEFFKEKYGDNVNFSVITDDVRNSQLALLTGSDTYKPREDTFDIVRNIFNNIHADIETWFSTEKNLWIWLLDNMPVFYEGKDLYDAINTLSVASLYDKPYVLKGLKKTEKRSSPVFPYFLQRNKALSN